MGFVQEYFLAGYDTEREYLEAEDPDRFLYHGTLCTGYGRTRRINEQTRQSVSQSAGRWLIVMTRLGQKRRTGVRHLEKSNPEVILKQTEAPETVFYSGMA